MPQSLTRLYAHLIFRRAMLTRYGIEFDEQYVWD
jgi:hypothetical protein